MLILGVDTSAPRGSVALANVRSPVEYKHVDLTSEKIEILAEQNWLRDKSHSELVTATLDETLRAAGARIQDIRGVAVGVGPGSFTGVRVGVNMAKALAFSLECPIWQIDSLKLWAKPLWENSNPILVGVFGFRDLIYTTYYSAPEKKQRSQLWPSQIMTADHLADQLPAESLSLVGDAWVKFPDRWPKDWVARIQQTSTEPPEAKYLFSSLVESPEWPEGTSWQNVKPLYIRGSEAEEKLRQGLLKPMPKI